MKKILLSVIITMCVMTGIGYGIITNITDYYEEKMESIKVESEEREAEIVELKSEVTEISDQVFNMMSGNAYEITIDHDGETHTWKSDNKGLFKRELHSVIY